jgi:hypothetical protein
MSCSLITILNHHQLFNCELTMTFKANWEKVDKQIQLPVQTIDSMVQTAFPNKKMSSYKIISGGCANLNIEINLDTDN